MIENIGIFNGVNHEEYLKLPHISKSGLDQIHRSPAPLKIATYDQIMGMNDFINVQCLGECGDCGRKFVEIPDSAKFFNDPALGGFYWN